ncbi:CNH domain-containing protein [Hysterangium stoloniferum]|nr:CNH domain-containing protein [Hysterangium stoloniferum]
MADPNKRTAAYESIFGRPSAQHHRPPTIGPSPLQFSHSPQYRPPQQTPQPYPYQSTYQQQQYYPPQEARRSYTGSISSHHTAPYSHQQAASQGFAPYRTQLAPPLEHGPYHAESVSSAQGIIAPLPEQPPDAGLEALTRQGLTPAQAYQQVYQNTPQHANHPPFRSVSPLPQPPSSSLNIFLPAIEPNPSLPSIEPEDGNTSVDFGGDSSQEDASSPRRSSESVPPLPRPKGARQRTVQDRSRSMSVTASQAKQIFTNTIRNSHPSLPSPTATVNHQPARRRAPIVYPALLSRVAEAFRTRVTLSERVKDGLTYNDAFDGREAVDKIAYIIKTTDRCLALLLGRALDAQKFFHDVTYDHRLRDSANELFQFKTRLSTPFVSGEELKEDELPTGVFTLLTDCYSPTCTRDRLCYSIACPRRLEQQSRLNLKQEPGLKRTISRESLGDLVEPGTLWVHSVPQEIVDSVSETEKKRQEAINEVIYTERDFVRDMEYLRDVWLKPLQNSNIIPEDRRQDFLSQVFWNINDIISVNTRLRDALNKRQKSYAVVERIGDILLDAVPHFGPFVSYGAHQLYGKYEFEKEKTSNMAFAQFVEVRVFMLFLGAFSLKSNEAERRPESRKLELNGYLTKPTTRLARYPLLLEVVLKYTAEDNPDKVALAQAVKIVREFLSKVNFESGKTENRFNLLQLDQQLVFRPGENVDLKLTEGCRELLYKGALKRRGGTQSDSADLQVFLFDHALLMVKQKSKHEQYKVYRPPIPLELLVVSSQDDTTDTRPLTSRGKNSLVKASMTGSSAPTKAGDSKNGYPITFVYLGRRSYQLTLWASTWVARKKWIENIQKAQEHMRAQSLFFDTFTLSEGFFSGINKVNCAAPFNNGRRVAYGTDDGVYFSDHRDPNREPMKVVALADVTHLDILDEYQLLIVLSDRDVITFPLDALDPRDPLAGLKRAKHVSTHTSYFKTGTCLGKTLVCVVKTTALSSTIRVMEPIDYNVRGKNKPTFRKLLQGGNDTLRSFKVFYIPIESNSVHFLKTRLCFGCVKGFEIIDLDTLETQTLLDHADPMLDFVLQKGEKIMPMALFRIQTDFLLCYDEFAFYVGRTGRRARPQFIVRWAGHPTAFAIQHPYLLAFDPTFVEIRHVETGVLKQVIQGNNLRCLFTDTQPTPVVLHNSYDSHQQQMYRDRNSYNQFGAPMYQGTPDARYGRNGRDDIIMVSDDSVLAVRAVVSDVISTTSR